MIGMSVGDQRALHGAYRVDEKIPGRAIEPFGAGKEKWGRAHEALDKRIFRPGKVGLMSKPPFALGANSCPR